MFHTIASICINLFSTPITDGCRHLLHSREYKASARRLLNSQPSDIFFITRFLRTDKVGPLFCYGTVIDARQRRILTVCIVVQRPPSKPCQLGAGIGHFQTEAQLRQYLSVNIRCNDVAYSNRSVRIHTETLFDSKSDGTGTGLIFVGNLNICPFMRFVFFNSKAASCQRKRTNTQCLPITFLHMVVFRWSTEGVKFQGSAYKGIAFVNILRKSSLCECDRKVFARYGTSGTACGQVQRVRSLILADTPGGSFSEFSARDSHFISGICPGSSLALCGTESYIIFVFRKHLDIIHRDVHQNTVVWCYVYIGQKSALYLYSVLLDAVAYIHIRQILLLQLVLKPESTFQAVLHDNIKRLVNGFHVEALGCGRAVGQYDTITAEGTVVGDIAEVTSVCPVELVCFATYWHTQALVLPVPYKFTGHGRVGFVYIAEHIFLVTHCITHRMRIFALDMWFRFLSALVVFQTAYACAEHVAVGTIHGAGYIAPSAVTLIVGDTTGIQLLDSLHHILEIVAATTLVAGTPAEDTGMIAKRPDLALVTFHHRSPEQLHTAQSHIAVTLYIGLSQNVKSVFVA